MDGEISKPKKRGNRCDVDSIVESIDPSYP